MENTGNTDIGILTYRYILTDIGILTLANFKLSAKQPETNERLHIEHKTLSQKNCIFVSVITWSNFHEF